MAHNKVVRRSMDKKEWIAIRTKWLKDRSIIESKKLSGWMIQEARQIEEMTYSYIGNKHPIEDGEMYFTPDGTVFLDNTFEIPEKWETYIVWFYFETAAEMMVKINGRWVGGIDPNRQRICIKEKKQRTKTIHIEMEGYNRSKPDDERNLDTAHLRGCRQVFNSGKIQVINDDILQAYYDAKILLETISCDYIEESMREKIEQELHQALLLISFDTTSFQVFEDGVKKFVNYINDTIYNEKYNYHIGKVALVAHSHLDIAYYWRRIHTVQKNARTCLIQLNLMEEYDNFKYAHTQAYTYETLEKYYPEIFERVKQRVLEGRFEIVGGMYVEPDCNIPTAESLIRQCLYGQHYFQDTFGITVNNCWLPDAFGNSWIMPQILKKSGMNYFVSNKMSTWNDTNRFPHNNFIWRGIDGSDVLACVPPTHFISWNTPEQIIENWESFQDKNVCEETLNMFGFGDGGSGVTEEMLEYMKRLNKIPSLPETRHIRGDEFLSESITYDQDLDTWDGELYLEMHRGTFTTKDYLKKYNRRFELMLRDVEYLWTIVYLNGGKYPQEKLDHLWKLLLINQFHDILPGTHIAPVETDVRKDYKYLEEELNNLRAEAVKYIAKLSKETRFKMSEEQVGINGEENLSEEDKAGEVGLVDDDSIQLINTLGWSRREPCFISESQLGIDVDYLKVDGVINQVGYHCGEKGLWVWVDDMKSFSTKTLNILKRKINTSKNTWFTWDNNKLVTPFYEVIFNQKGTIESLYVKQLEKELVEKGKTINNLKLYHDYPGKYDAWDILNNYKDVEDEVVLVDSIKIVEQGELYLALEINYKTKKSKWCQKIRFYQYEERIDFDYEVDWYEKQRLAKVEFNFNILARQAGCDTSAGTIYRDTHKNTSWQKAKFEVCMHKYVDLYEHGFGAALINESKYGVSIDKSQIGLSLLRGTIRPDNHSDMGKHKFSYALIPHELSLEQSQVIEQAWSFNVPFIVTKDLLIEPNCPIRIEGSKLHLQSIKKAQKTKDNTKIIVRLTELKGMRGKTRINLSQSYKSVYEVNMLEERDPTIVKSILNHDKDSIEIAYQPYEIITLALEF